MCAKTGLSRYIYSRYIQKACLLRKSVLTQIGFVFVRMYFARTLPDLALAVVALDRCMRKARFPEEVKRSASHTMINSDPRAPPTTESLSHSREGRPTVYYSGASKQRTYGHVLCQLFCPDKSITMANILPINRLLS